MTRVYNPGPLKTRFIQQPKKKSKNSETAGIIQKYYKTQIQTGHGSPDFYHGSTLNRGHGIADVIKSAFKIAKPVLKGLFKVAKPHIKKTAKKIGSRVLKTGGEIVSDALEGKNIKKATKERSGRAFEKFKRESVDSIQRVLRPPISPPKKRKKAKNNNKRFNRKKIRSDNFGPY